MLGIRAYQVGIWACELGFRARREGIEAHVRPRGVIFMYLLTWPWELVLNVHTSMYQGLQLTASAWTEPALPSTPSVLTWQLEEAVSALDWLQDK